MKKSKKLIKIIARERIYRLFELAEKAKKENNEELSNYYVRLAWKIALKYNVRMPLELRPFFCRKCLSYLVPNEDSEIKSIKNIEGNLWLVKITCKKCNYVRTTKIFAEKED